MHLRLLREMLPLWIGVIKLYANSRQLLPDNRALHYAKHKSAEELAVNLELCFHTNDALERERREAKRNKLRMLRQLVKKKPLIKRPDSAQSATPLMTPLFLTRGNSAFGTPGTEATADTATRERENSLLQEVKYMLMDEIDKIDKLLEEHQHDPGSYNVLLRIMLINIKFTITKAEFFSPTEKIKPEFKVVENLVAYLCVLSFDHLASGSTLTASGKNRYSIGSGFTLSACKPDDVFKQIEELEHLAYHLYDQVFLEYLDGPQSENYTLSRHCHFAKIVEQLGTLPTKPQKIKEMMDDIQALMKQIEQDYNKSDPRKFRIDLERFKVFFNKSTWQKMGDVITILSNARQRARAVSVSPAITYYPSSGFMKPEPPWERVLNDSGASDETIADTPPQPQLKFPPLVHG